MDREAWHAAVHGIAESESWHWTELNPIMVLHDGIKPN